MAILYYLAHDPISNSEAMLTEYDAELIKRADESGIVFIAVDDQGTRSIVPASDVREPENRDEHFTFVQPLYVDDRFKAVVDVFDALAASVPAVASNADVQPVFEQGAKRYELQRSAGSAPRARLRHRRGRRRVMSNTRTLELDISKEGAGTCIKVGQGDDGGTTINALIYDNGAEFSLSGATVWLVALLPNKRNYYRGQCSVSGNAATIIVDESKLCSVPGYTDEAYFTITKGGNTYSTERFALDILRSAL